MVSKQTEQKLKNVIRIIKSPIPKLYHIKIREMPQAEIIERYGGLAVMEEYGRKNVTFIISPRASEKKIAHEFAHLIYDNLPRLFILEWEKKKRGKQWSSEEDFARVFENVYNIVKNKRKAETKKEKIIKKMFF